MKDWPKYRNTIAKIGAGITVVLLLNLPIVGVSTISAEEMKHNQIKENSYVFTLRQGENTDEMIREIRDKYPDLKLEVIKEIKMLNIEGDNLERVQEAKQHLLKNYKGIIEKAGREDVVELKPPAIVKKPSNITKYAPSQLEQEEVDYSKWKWDVDKVTENGESYKIEQGNHSVKIGVIDSGIDVNHPALKGNIVSQGKILVPNVESIEDNIGHGTMIAGLIAADGKIKGVAPKIGIVPYKVFQGSSADSSWIIKAIVEAANDGMDVINLSLGTYKSIKDPEEGAVYLAYKRAIEYANSKGSLLVASSGTEGFDISNPFQLAKQRGYENDLQLHMPGGLPGVVTVAGTNKDDRLAYYSNYGTNVDIAAPSGDYGSLWESEKVGDETAMVLTTYPTNLPQSQLSEWLGFDRGYELMIGTSLAVPKVSATAALVIAEYKEKFRLKPSNGFVKTRLYQGAKPALDDGKKYFGKGIVNAKGALDFRNTNFKKWER
ncbi:peptidase S8 [Bacillus thuringiensis]|uniref:S8 family peptidase n=1 Tax=Bacillus thuringiensis TaxID=1428 RepID=UPI000BF43BF9|nr:S8 family serine peptidase [Bacillus thuringiensis]PEY59806.1 peptidase S8 [Bacillus thuringiensis]PFM24551.1 peptidase S8 [Bacillus thuringiensis]